MQLWQTIIVSIFLISGFSALIHGYYQSKLRSNPYAPTTFFYYLGAFVWGDTLIFGPFWIITSLVCLLRQDWTLFLLTISIFWLVRSLGETIYWFNQQFSQIERNPPTNLAFHQLMPGDAIWYGYQIFWQCITVITAILSLYFSYQWVQTITLLS